MISFWLIFTFLSAPWMSSASGFTACSDLPTGVQKMILGVDITSLDVVPIDFQGDNGFKKPVLNFSCDSDRSWKSPSGIVKQLPDQVWQMTSEPGGWLTADVDFYQTYNEVRQSMSYGVGGEGSLFNFAFSASQNYKKLQNSITNKSKYIYQVSSFESATHVDLHPSEAIELDYFAQNYIDRKLKDSFESDPAAYFKFIYTFGTHYFSSANFGGFIWMLFETNKDYFYSHSESDIETNAKVSFLDFISLHGGGTSTTSTIDQTFSQATTETIKYYGGDTNLLTQNGFQSWQPSVDQDPWLFSGQLTPISDLILDEKKKKVNGISS
ncbi:perivitellin-2 67 kDa subunit-like [Physella acuta]|uniref:perivitellin-2 67 kDa subunit-like n=1 Tax=Physella acuta TaxID=109671 RepID=UPI0027DBB85D|nr:perivitellin-2 67 kDa subunit-like [Physella acuta]